MPSHNNRPVVIVLEHSLARHRPDLERAGYWAEHSTSRYVVMRQDFPAGVLTGIEELAKLVLR